MPARLRAVVVGSAAPHVTASWYRTRLGLDGSGPVLDAGDVRLVVAPEIGAPSRAIDPSRLIANFAVRDVLAVEAWLVENETTWIRELESTPWGTIGTVLDADGNYVQVLDDRGRRA